MLQTKEKIGSDHHHAYIDTENRYIAPHKGEISTRNDLLKAKNRIGHR